MPVTHKIRPDLENLFGQIAQATEEIKKKLPGARTRKEKFVMQGIVSANITTLNAMVPILNKLKQMEDHAEREMLKKTGGIMPASQGPLIQVVGGFRDK